MKCTASITAAILTFAATASAAPAASKHQPILKRGLAFNEASATSLFSTKAVSWSYNWASAPGGKLAPGIQYVPMLYNGVDANWDTNVKAAMASGSTHLLGPNEPDQPISAGGTALDPHAAAQTYIDMMTTPYAGKMKLGAPAVSAGGIAWLQTFAEACAGKCKIDFVPLHFYDYSHPQADIQYDSMSGWLEATIPQVRSMFNSPKMEFWVTEFAVTPFTDAALASSYMGQALPYLEANHDIARYSYFEAAEGMLTSGAALTSAGQTYNTPPA